MAMEFFLCYVVKICLIESTFVFYFLIDSLEIFSGDIAARRMILKFKFVMHTSVFFLHCYSDKFINLQNQL